MVLEWEKEICGEKRKEKIRQHCRNYYAKNREILLERSRIRYTVTKEKTKKARQAYYKENRESLLQYKREWYLANRDRLRQARNNNNLAKAG